MIIIDINNSVTMQKTNTGYVIKSKDYKKDYKQYFKSPNNNWFEISKEKIKKYLENNL